MLLYRWDPMVYIISMSYILLRQILTNNFVLIQDTETM